MVIIMIKIITNKQTNNNDNKDSNNNYDSQVGDIGGGWWNGLYLDYFLLLTFGGIPWQVIAKSKSKSPGR